MINHITRQSAEKLFRMHCGDQSFQIVSQLLFCILRLRLN